MDSSFIFVDLGMAGRAISQKAAKGSVKNIDIINGKVLFVLVTCLYLSLTIWVVVSHTGLGLQYVIRMHLHRVVG